MNKDHGAGELSLAYYDPIEISDSKINEKNQEVLLIMTIPLKYYKKLYTKIDNKKGAILKYTIKPNTIWTS